MSESKSTKSDKLAQPSLQVSDVSSFVAYVVKWKIAGVSPTAFRGQSHYGWKARPKAFRKELNFMASEDLAVRDIVSIHPNEFVADNTMFDRLVRMQHFGMPTRLLDVTTNPLVALWFATEPCQNIDEAHGSIQALLVPKNRRRYYDSDRVSCMANIANLKKSQKETLFINAAKNLSIKDFNSTDEADMLLFHIGFEKPQFRPRIVPEDLLKAIYVKPKMSNKRIIAQSGAFLLYGTDDEESGAAKGIRGSRLWIHEDDKSSIRRDLELLGIHESVLFPEIDKATKFIAEMYGPNGRGRRDDPLI